MLELTLPWPPNGNHFYTVVHGRKVLSSEGRKYHEAVADQVLIQRGARGYLGSLEVAIVAHVPDKRRRDLDNLLKGVLDALTKAGVWADDSQIDALSIKRGPIGGLLKVTVNTL